MRNFRTVVQLPLQKHKALCVGSSRFELNTLAVRLLWSWRVGVSVWICGTEPYSVWTWMQLFNLIRRLSVAIKRDGLWIIWLKWRTILFVRGDHLVVLQLIQELMRQILEVIWMQTPPSILKRTIDLPRPKQLLPFLNIEQTAVLLVSDVSIVKWVVLFVLANVLVVIDCAARNVLVQKLVVVEVTPHSFCHRRAYLALVKVVQYNSSVTWNHMILNSYLYASSHFSRPA